MKEIILKVNLKKAIFTGLVFFILAVLMLSTGFFIKETTINYSLGKPEGHIGEMKNDVLVEQYFISPKENLSGLQIQFATFARENTSNIIVKLKEENKVIYETEVNSKNIIDNGFTEFYFDNIDNSDGKNYKVEIYSEDASAGNALTIWKNNSIVNGGQLYINNQLVDGNINMKLLYEDINYYKIILFICLIVFIFIVQVYSPSHQQSKSKFKNALSLSLLFLISIVILFIRNADPIFFPILYAEDGVWAGKLLSMGTIDVGFNARGDYPVLGNVLLLKAGLIISNLFFGLNISHLPTILALISYIFITLTAMIGFIVLKPFSYYLGILTYVFVIVMPLGQDGNEIIGRILNLGFLFPVISIFLLTWRLNQQKCRLSVLIVDIFNLVSCLTAPVTYGVVAIYLFLDFNIKKGLLGSNIRNYMLRNIVPILTVFSGFILVPTLIGSEGGASGLSFSKEGFIEFAIARTILYPLMSSYWTKLTDIVVIIIFILYSLLILSALLIKLKNSSDYRWYMFLFGASCIYWVGLIIPRIGFTSILIGYSSTFPDRYFYGTNILSICLFFSALYIITEHMKFSKARIFIAILTLFSVLSTKSVFEFNNPSLQWREYGTIGEVVFREYNLISQTSDLNQLDKVTIPIPPNTKEALWSMEVPFEYAIETVTGINN